MGSKKIEVEVIQTDEPMMSVYTRLLKRAAEKNSRGRRVEAEDIVVPEKPRTVEVSTKDELKTAIDAKASEIAVLDPNLASDVRRTKELGKKALAVGAAVGAATAGYVVFKRVTGGKSVSLDGLSNATVCFVNENDVPTDEAAKAAAILKLAGIGIIGSILALAIYRNYDVEVVNEYETPDGQKFKNTTILKKRKP